MHISIFSGHIVLYLCNPQFLAVSADWQNAPTSQPLHWEYGHKGRHHPCLRKLKASVQLRPTDTKLSPSLFSYKDSHSGLQEPLLPHKREFKKL